MKDVSLSVKHFGFALILPVCAILVTSALWLGARGFQFGWGLLSFGSTVGALRFSSASTANSM